MTYFRKPSLPANTIVKFVPQQTAYIVERMGKFNRILNPGLAVLVPVADRIGLSSHPAASRAVTDTSQHM